MTRAKPGVWLRVSIVCGVAFVAVLATRVAAQPGKPAGSSTAGLPAVRAPIVKQIRIPEVRGQDAVWGTPSLDSKGRVWFSVCITGVRQPSAVLFDYDPATGKVTPHGDAIGELTRLKLVKPGEGQELIHTRITEATDGNLYFATTDAEDKASDGTRLPKWGSHIWRLRMPAATWEHVKFVPEEIITSAGQGPVVYFLGNFQHTLFRLDTRTGDLKSIKVGSLESHISRRIFCDLQGHVYVPRVTRPTTPGTTASASLVEFDENLNEIGSSPLQHYASGTKPIRDTHGIVASQIMKDGTIYFVTHFGNLYKVEPRKGQPAAVSSMGFMHPGGTRYIASLFTDKDEKYLFAQARQSDDLRKGQRYEWLVYDLESWHCVVTPFEIDIASAPKMNDSLMLYGSETRDAQGNFYVAGTQARPGFPVLLQIRPAPQ